jgi:uncharacterized iron-regulated protein
MQHLKVSALIVLSLFMLSLRSDKPAYRLFDDKGKESSYEKLLKEARKADIILFGELHNNAIAHWMQLELTRDLFAVLQEEGRSLQLGAEMFEADGQTLLDEYLSSAIDARSFEQQGRLWPNYKTDYKPLVDFAREKNLRFIASNVPRRYASIVNRKGFEGLDSLDAAAYNWIAPLPIVYDPELKAYKEMLSMGAGHGAVNENLPKAQALKDATMAFFILKNRQAGTPFLHYHGAYHSDFGQGIAWYLKLSAPELRILTITTVELDDLDSLGNESEGQADFILAVPASMTKTH